MDTHETTIREDQCFDGWWIVGAERDGQLRWVELEPDATPQLRELAGRLCAMQLNTDA